MDLSMGPPDPLQARHAENVLRDAIDTSADGDREHFRAVAELALAIGRRLGLSSEALAEIARAAEPTRADDPDA